jgi:hypothetical protein
VREVEFRIEARELGVGVEDVACFYIDGVRLEQLAREAEFALGGVRGVPDRAGSYAGLLDGSARATPAASLTFAHLVAPSCPSASRSKPLQGTRFEYAKVRTISENAKTLNIDQSGL